MVLWVHQLAVAPTDPKGEASDSDNSSLASRTPEASEGLMPSLASVFQIPARISWLMRAGIYCLLFIVYSSIPINKGVSPCD